MSVLQVSSVPRKTNEAVHSLMFSVAYLESYLKASLRIRLHAGRSAPRSPRRLRNSYVHPTPDFLAPGVRIPRCNTYGVRISFIRILPRGSCKTSCSAYSPGKAATKLYE